MDNLAFDVELGEYDSLSDITTHAWIWGRFGLNMFEHNLLKTQICLTLNFRMGHVDVYS